MLLLKIIKDPITVKISGNIPPSEEILDLWKGVKPEVTSRHYYMKNRISSSKGIIGRNLYMHTDGFDFRISVVNNEVICSPFIKLINILYVYIFVSSLALLYYADGWAKYSIPSLAFVFIITYFFVTLHSEKRKMKEDISDKLNSIGCDFFFV